MLNLLRRKQLTPFQQFVDAAMEECQYSPDALKLHRKHDHLVFLVDELMSRHAGHQELGQSKVRLVENAVSKDRMTLWQHEAGKYSSAVPIVDAVEGVQEATVRGELFFLETNDLLGLDKYKRNGVEFLRVPVQVLIPYHNAKKKIEIKDRSLTEWAIEETLIVGEVPAWMYVGHPDYWNPLINKGTKMVHHPKDGSTKRVARFNGGNTYAVSTLIKPNNPKLENYYHFRPNDAAKRSDNS